MPHCIPKGAFFGSEFNVDTILMTWLVMVLLLALAFVVRSRLSLDRPRGAQNVLEFAFEFVNGLGLRWPWRRARRQHRPAGGGDVPVHPDLELHRADPGPHRGLARADQRPQYDGGAGADGVHPDPGHVAAGARRRRVLQALLRNRSRCSRR